MPRSEIDDIFASKHKSSLPVASSSSQPPPEKPKKKKKGAKKSKQLSGDGNAEDEQPAVKSVQRRIPETVLDPSVRPPTLDSQPAKASSTTKIKKRKREKDDEDRFRDSRGTGPRRKTEEGFSIFKEDELGITDAGGDTPLCPFDCQCCF